MAEGVNVPGQPVSVFSTTRHAAHRMGRRQLGKSLLLLVISLLLGHAVIGHVISPFALAFFAVTTEVSGPRKGWPAWGAIISVYLMHGMTSSLLLAGQFILYLLLRRAFFPKRSPDIHFTPFVAGLIDVVARLASGGVWSNYDVFVALAEGALVTILSFIFFQCAALLNGRTPVRMRTDQLLSVTILTGSVISGLSGISFHDIPAVFIGIDIMVLLMAAAGGVGVSTTVGMVVGTLAMLNHSLSLSQVAVLGFSAMLAGALKEAGRMWLGLAFVGSEAVLTLTLQVSWSTEVQVVFTAGIAAILVMVIPKSWVLGVARYIPGTAEHHNSELQHVRRVRSLLSEKITELSQVFEELSHTFKDTGESEWITSQKLVDETMSGSAREVCTGCARRSKCWEKEGLATYQALIETIARLEQNKVGLAAATPELKERCIRLDSMLGVLKRNAALSERDAKWMKSMRNQSELVSAQLSGVATVIRSVASHVDKGTEDSATAEEQVITALEQLGLYVDNVRIVSLDPGKVEVEVTQPSQGAYENSVRMIAPLLSGIVGENISVNQVDGDSAGPCKAVFTSGRLFDVKTAVATVAKDGRLVSGDSNTALDLGNGRFALAVSDGMGNGERAHRESSAAVELLKKLLKAGFDQQLAIKTVNSTLLLRSRDEIFTTLDMTLIDLYSASAEFLKIGSSPSFIKRGPEVTPITGANVPIGILQEIEVQTSYQQLQRGDLLILMSDGVYDAAKHVYDQDDWLKRQIERLETDDPQEIADTLIETAVRVNHGQILDDMTVLVAVIEEHQPEWAAIRVPGVVGLRQQNQDKRSRRGA